MIDRFNKWYDAVREPYRFLLAMALIMSGITALSFGDWSVKLAGAAYLGVLFFVRVKGRLNASA